MAKLRLKIFSASLIALLVVTTSGLVFGAWFLKKWEDEVTKKFEGRKWDLASKIYSDSYPIYLGFNLRLEDLAEKLGRLGYFETPAAPKTKGAYRLVPAEGVAEIFLHDFEFPTDKVTGHPVRISLQGGVVSRIEDIATGKELTTLELEPELVTGLYQRIWQERRIVKLAEVPPLLIKTVLAVEDERFFSHMGVDPIGIMRAMLVNLRHLSLQQGGSTLTQQLMKNFLLSDERTLSRKFPEAVMALIAERKYSKEVILENYLNEIYLGQRGSQGIHGVWEAAQFYFAKPLSELTVAETALLAGLIRAPNRLSPYKNADGAVKRRNVILAKLLDDKVISKKQFDTALKEKLPARPLVKVTNEGPYYVDYLRRELDQIYSSEVLTREGLRIFTGLDLQMQKIAEKALAEGLAKLETTHPALKKKASEEQSLEGAIVVIRPQSGEIKAMVGGRSYQKSQFNRVFQAKRQPGSVFKPFVFLAALMHGGQSGPYSPDTVINDSQFTWHYDGGQDWQPTNYNNEYFGAVTVRRALEASLNSATARVAQDVGVRRVRDVARRLGIESALPAVPSLSLGSAEVTPLEVAVAFSTLANNGVRTRPLAVKHVVDPSSKILEKRDVKVEQVISHGLAYTMNQLLRGVFDRGTAAPARRWGFTRPAAGKTGTTNDYKDAWFVGYTPELLAVVWVGYDGPAKIGLSGAEAALPIWTEFMKKATANMPVTDFIPPPAPKRDPTDVAPEVPCGPATREGEPAGEPCPPPAKAPEPA